LVSPTILWGLTARTIITDLDVLSEIASAPLDGTDKFGPAYWRDEMSGDDEGGGDGSSGDQEVRG